LESKEDADENSEPLRMEYLTASIRPGTPIQRKIEVEPPERTELSQEYVDATYWRQPIVSDAELSELMEGYE